MFEQDLIVFYIMYMISFSEFNVRIFGNTIPFGFTGIIFILFWISLILNIIGMWKILKGEGKNGSISLVPIFNSITYSKIVGYSSLWIILNVVLIFMFSFNATYYLVYYFIYKAVIVNKTYKYYNTSKKFAIGMFLYSPLFIYLLSRRKKEEKVEIIDISNNVNDVSNNPTMLDQFKNDIKELSLNKGLTVFLVVIIFLLGLNLIGNKYMGSSKNLGNITTEFKNYLENNYNIRISDYSKVNICNTAFEDCDYVGIFTLEDDLSYRIRIEKTGNNYRTSYLENAPKMRKELYEYANSLKNGNLGKNYLEYENKDNNFSFFDLNDTELKYIVYTNNDEVSEDDMQSDFMIIQKANEIIEKYNIKEGSVRDIDIMYTKDNRILSDNWIKDAYQNKDLDDLANVYAYFKPDSFGYGYDFDYSLQYYEGMNFETFKKTVRNEIRYRNR